MGRKGKDMKAYAQHKQNDGRRDSLIVAHVDVAKRIALRVARRVPDWICVDDLIAAGMMGLAEAADRFDEGRGEPFVAFAEKRIRGAVLDELRRGDIMPRRVRTKARQVGKVIRELEQRLGRAPEDEEIAEGLEVSVEEYRDNLAALSHVALIEVTPEIARSEAYNGKDEASPRAQAERSEMLRLIEEALHRLEERDALILSLYYNEQFTYSEIGGLLEVSESRVCQLHSRAIARLRIEVHEPVEERLA
ncbi:MAG: FliA/WhiG family RNA polymerase sigma factor [Myxococcales bacterium]|nr:FliA/WhiG family RNA polymerase sigma factor [Myxococcales bacterium]